MYCPALKSNPPSWAVPATAISVVRAVLLVTIAPPAMSKAAKFGVSGWLAVALPVVEMRLPNAASTSGWAL